VDTTGLALLIIAVGIVLVALIAIGKTVKVIQQGSVGVVKRLGQFKAIHNPGLVFIAPFMDQLTLVDVREVPRTGDRQEVITRDNVAVAVNATIFSQVVDPQPALFSVSNYLVATDQIARTTLRSVFGSLTLDEALSQRERINAQLQQQMETVTDKWGVRINRVEIVDITPPGQILAAMALQKTAEQEKRAAILQSEGQQQSAVNVADGQRQSAIKQAEGQKESAVLRAEGNRQAAILEADGRSQAITTVYNAIRAANPDQTLVAILQLDTLSKFADSKAGTIVIPYEAAGLMGAAQALRGVLNGPGSLEGQGGTPAAGR
jgi:regulator of protease activity HflC (stomatin/prohibitin superfamily)